MIEGIGPYVIPSPAQVDAAALQIISCGGRVHADAHRSQLINYADDPEGLRVLRKNTLARTPWTCSCGASGVVAELPALAAAGESPESSGTTRLCIRCDAVHLMPNFREEVNA